MKKWSIVWLAALISVGFPDVPLEIMAVALVLIVLIPCFIFLHVTIKWMAFLYLPSPIQLWKGFKHIWPVVKSGPVVTRIKRPPSPPTP